MARHDSELEKIMALLKGRKAFLESKYKIKEIGIFGSFVREEQNRGSDLDILVKYRDDSIDIFDFLELKEYLSELVGIEVDLVMQEGLKPFIGKNILNQVKYA
ncbi:MAG: nucleotidyltransferase family protein [bacterium]|nr:nucleotidyltransferase family protein [bacterium]